MTGADTLRRHLGSAAFAEHGSAPPLPGIFGTIKSEWDMMADLIHLTEAEEHRCKEIALARLQSNETARVQSYKKSSRHTDLQIHVLGVIGEYIVARALGLGGFQAFDDHGPTRRGDILLPSGEYLEVKTTAKPWYNFLIKEDDTPQDGHSRYAWEPLFQCSYGALVWKMPAPLQYSLVGWCTQDEFRQNKTWADYLPRPCWLLSWHHFHAIDELKGRWVPVQQALW